jgi:hemolysin III
MEQKLSSTTSISLQDLSLEERLLRVKHLSSEDEWIQGMLLDDEWANSLTHGLGFILSCIGLILLMMTPFQEGNHWKLLNFGVYGLSLVLLYAASTLYHAVRRPILKRAFRTVDHCAIYLLIAGTYTPFTMLLLKGVWGWTLFGIVWSLAFAGIIFKIFFRHQFKVLSTCIYLFMGWLVVAAIEPLFNSFHYAGLFWLFGGGVSYTIGVIFYVLDKRRFYHAIWHLFVLGGSTCHYLAVFLYL